MRLAFIGMSGSGKSYWSSLLAEHGFKRYCCDDLIDAKLSRELVWPDGSLMTLGEWMGFPFHKGYAERESAYLTMEREVLAGVLRDLAGKPATAKPDVVVDTTGSVIYTGEEVLEELRAHTHIVYFSVSPAFRRQLLDAYLRNRRPILWRGMFQVNPGETNHEALARCYESLLASRERLYESLADAVIDMASLKSPMIEVESLIERIEAQIRR